MNDTTVCCATDSPKFLATYPTLANLQDNPYQSAARGATIIEVWLVWTVSITTLLGIIAFVPSAGFGTDVDRRRYIVD